MIDQKTEKPQTSQLSQAAWSSKTWQALSRREFMDLGATTIVYPRILQRDDVIKLIPDIELSATEMDYHLLFAANGAPVIISDSYEGLQEWVDNHEADLAEIN